MPRRRSPTAAPPAPVAASRARARWAAVLALATLVGAGLAWQLTRPRPIPGPIVLVSIDTLRADRLPVYGYSEVQTPALDEFAADAVIFDRAYTHAPTTLPAHVSLLSGRLPFEHGVRDNLGFRVEDDLPLLPAMLSPHGFVSAGIVSSYVLREETGLDRGFDHYDSRMPSAAAEASIAELQRGGLESVAEAVAWLSQVGSDRFFLFVHLYEPHTPYAPPARHAHHEDPYDGEVAFSDEITGRLFDALRTRGLYDPATILLVSDHGEGLGDHGELEHGVFLYDESIRVPFIVKLPHSANGGARVAQPVQLIDVVPTILRLIGAPVPGHLRGRSLAPVLAAPASPLPDRAIYAEAMYPRYHFGWSELLSLTDARYRFIKAPREELYDLERDPGETRNLAADLGQIRDAMRSALDRLVASEPIDAPSAVSDDARRRLQALGYVGASPPTAPSVEGASLADPKDQIGLLADYRRAVSMAGQGRLGGAIALLEQVVRESPAMTNVWERLGTLQVRAGRLTDAVESYTRIIELRPTDPAPLTAVAGVLLRLGRLDDAKAHAMLAASQAPDRDPRRAEAETLLARIALAQQDPAGARRHADLARQADPTLPLPTYIEARLEHARQRYAAALPLFEDVVRQLGTRARPLDEAHFYTADTLARLERYAEAEAHFLEELRLFPTNGRAHASLALLYRAQGRDADAEAIIASLLARLPTPEGYARAIELWTVFDEEPRAEALRREAARRFGAVEAPGRHEEE